MAIACKCDRCKKFFEIPYKNEGVQRVKKISTFRSTIEKSSVYAPLDMKEFDLCDDCANDFMLWMEHYTSETKDFGPEDIKMCSNCLYYNSDYETCHKLGNILVSEDYACKRFVNVHKKENENENN